MLVRGRTDVRCVGENIFTVVFIYQNQKANEYFVKSKDGKITFNRVKVDLVKNLAKFGVIKKEHM